MGPKQKHTRRTAYTADLTGTAANIPRYRYRVVIEGSVPARDAAQAKGFIFHEVQPMAQTISGAMRLKVTTLRSSPRPKAAPAKTA